MLFVIHRYSRVQSLLVYLGVVEKDFLTGVQSIGVFSDCTSCTVCTGGEEERRTGGEAGEEEEKRRRRGKGGGKEEEEGERRRKRGGGGEKEEEKRKKLIGFRALELFLHPKRAHFQRGIVHSDSEKANFSPAALEGRKQGEKTLIRV